MAGKIDKLEQRVKEMMEMMILQDDREHSSKTIIKEEILSFNGKPVNVNRIPASDEYKCGLRLMDVLFSKEEMHVPYYLNRRGNVTNQDWIRNVLA